MTIMIVAFSILALLKPVQASVGSYGRFDSVEVFSRSDEASNVNYNDAGYFEGKVPREHSDVDHVLIRGNYTFEAKYRDTIKIINYFYASYHYYIAAGYGHALIQTFYYIYEKETGLLSGPWEIFRDGGYHTSAWSPPDEGQNANWQFRTSWAWTFELIEGFTYTLMYFFKVSATVGSYVE
ncbi:MAG: hypothetical protein ACE5I5_20170 [Candidatus Heimdallarchaeota archaeon]